MKLRCQNCGHEFDGGITKDSFGGHCVCPKCNRGFGVDVLEGRIIMAFAWDETDEYFTDDWSNDNKIATYYAFNAPGEFIKAWEKMVEDPDGMWYWVLDGEELVCSGACDPGDIDIFENYWGLQLKITDPDLNFVSDYDKMRDFEILTKDEFLNSYSYLTEEEYDATQLYLNWIREKESRAKTLLYNAISLLIDETLGEDELFVDWLNDLCEKMGTTPSELRDLALNLMICFDQRNRRVNYERLFGRYNRI